MSDTFTKLLKFSKRINRLSGRLITVVWPLGRREARHLWRRSMHVGA